MYVQNSTLQRFLRGQRITPANRAVVVCPGIEVAQVDESTPKPEFALRTRFGAVPHRAHSVLVRGTSGLISLP